MLLRSSREVNLDTKRLQVNESNKANNWSYPKENKQRGHVLGAGLEMGPLFEKVSGTKTAESPSNMLLVRHHSGELPDHVYVTLSHRQSEQVDSAQGSRKLFLRWSMGLVLSLTETL